MLILFIHLPLTQITRKLSLSFVCFCQNLTFPTKFSDAKQLTCLPLSSFLWIGDNPFWILCAWGCLGGGGRARTTNQVSSSMLRRALCGYQPQASFCPLTAQTAAKTDPGTLWKMAREHHRPPLLANKQSVLWLASYGLLTLSAGPIRGSYEHFAIFWKQCWTWLDLSRFWTPGLLRLHGQAEAAWAQSWPNSPGASKDNLFPSAAGNQPGELDLARKIFLSTTSD